MNSLYKSMQGLLSRAQAFGTELSTEDIASMYLSQMEQLNQIQNLKANFDKSKEIMLNNDAANEIAVNALGQLVAQDKDRNIVYANSIADIEKNNLTPLTNSQISDMRAFSPAFARRTDLDAVLANGVGMSKIGEEIRKLIPTIGTDKLTEEGYTKVQAGQIQKGFELLLGQAPDGDYSYTKSTESQDRQRKAALGYITAMLPKNMKAVLKANADLQGIKAEDMLQAVIGAGDNTMQSITFDAVTGKAAKDSEGKSKSDSGLEINSAVQLLAGMSSPREFTFNIGNGNSFSGLARISSINDVDEKPFGGDFSYSEIYKSSLRKNLDLDNASFGDVPINKSLKDRIIVDNSTIAGIDLPYTKDKNGRIIPDFKMLQKIEEADNEIMRQGIDPNNSQAVNAIYAKYKLPIKYGPNNQLTGNYKRFAVIQATAIEDVFLNKDGLASNGTLTLVSDEEERDKYIEEIKKSTGKKDIDMDRPGIFTGDKDVYKGSIFIPIIGDLTDAISGSKIGKLTENNYDDYRNKWNTKNYVKAPQFVKQ